MPPWIDSPEEVGAILTGVVVVVGSLAATVLAALGGVYAVWRSKIKPLLAGTQAAASSAAEQLQTNHGSSMRDAVNRIEHHILDIRADQRNDRITSERARAEIFRRIRALETPGEDTRP